MILYAETSAILAWLLHEDGEGDVLRVLGEAERTVSSDLTALESARGLARLAFLGRVSRAEELAALKLFDLAAARWSTLPVAREVLARARGPFPVEPVRALDAIHLATALAFRDGLGPLTVLSLDARIRENAKGLRLEVGP